MSGVETVLSAVGMKKAAAAIPFLLGAVTIEWKHVRENWPIITIVGLAVITVTVSAHRFQVISEYIDNEPAHHATILKAAISEANRIKDVAVKERKQETNVQLIEIIHKIDIMNITLRYLSEQEGKGGRFTSGDGDDLRDVDIELDKRIRLLEDNLHGQSRFKAEGIELEKRIRKLENLEKKD